MVMKNLEGDMRFASGYAGEDSMRTKAHKLLGQEFANTPMTPPASMTTPSREKMRLYKKGGSVKGDEKKMSHGGRADEDNEAGGHLTNLYLPKQMKLNVENFREATGKKKGGCVHKARGGSIYEHQMDGEHPSRKMPHVNYESEMMGETPERKAQSGKPIRRPSNVMDASHGQYKKKGGRVAMAAGGVAKIRHGVATKNGKPINRKVVRGS